MSPPGAASASSASNQYQILGHLATGGMAELYLARAVGIAGFERYVVLKRIMAEHSRNHRFVTMFLDEARLAAQLHHPNIAQVYDIGRVSDSYFFTLEYVHGENCRDVLQRVAALKRQIPIEQTLGVIAGAAAGLHYAHEKRGIDRQPLGIVHRDVSPSNLMVSYEGAVKLVDFGIAKAAHRMTETRSGAVKGKVAYMSPEQCTGTPVDRRSDIFSLGIVFFEMATMTRLFKYPTDFETMTNIVNGAQPSPSSRRPDLSRELEAVILKCLAKKPDDRFQNAEELLQAIDAVSEHDRLELSAPSLGRYIRELFGERPEPWYELEAAGEHTGLVTIETTSAGELAPDAFGAASTQKGWNPNGPIAGGPPTEPMPVVHMPSARLPLPPPDPETPDPEDDPAMAPTLLAPTGPLAVPQIPSHVLRDAPDREPSWGGERDPSWRSGSGSGSGVDVVDLRERRPWVLWSAIAAMVVGLIVIIVATSGDGGEPVAVPGSDPEPVAVPEPKPEPVAAPEAKPEPVAVPEPKPEPVAVPEPEPVAVPVPEPEPEPVLEPEPVAGSGSGSAVAEPVAVKPPPPTRTTVPKTRVKPKVTVVKPDRIENPDPKPDPKIKKPPVKCGGLYPPCD